MLLLLKNLRLLNKIDLGNAEHLDATPGFEWTGTVKPTNQPADTKYITIPLGDGTAEFLGDDMTEREVLEYSHEEEHGWSEFYKKLPFFKKKPDAH